MDDNDRLPISVMLKMMDGEVVNGDMILSIGGAVERTLNNDTKFIRFNDGGSEDRFISKTAIFEVQQKGR